MKLFYVTALTFCGTFSSPTPEDALTEKANYKILKDERSFGDDGSYSFKFKTENGIERSETGSVKEEGGPVVSKGEISYKMPNGEMFYLTYIADENGYQPQSNFLPVAPAFPYPIPDFVQRQIEKAKMEDEAREKALQEEIKMTKEEEEEEEKKTKESMTEKKEEDKPNEMDTGKIGKEQGTKIADEIGHETDHKHEEAWTTEIAEAYSETTTQASQDFAISELEDKMLDAFLNSEMEARVDKNVTDQMEASSTAGVAGDKKEKEVNGEPEEEEVTQDEENEEEQEFNRKL